MNDDFIIRFNFRCFLSFFFFLPNFQKIDARRYERPGNVNERLWQQAIDANPDPSRLGLLLKK